MDADVAVLGGGAAGLAVVTALERTAAREFRRPPSVLLLDPVHRSGDDRTWCFWDRGGSPLAPVVHRRWDRVTVVDAAGRAAEHHLGQLGYSMVRSSDYYRAADAAAARIGVRRVTERVRMVTPRRPGRPGPVGVHWATGSAGVGWVLDSRPVPPRRVPVTSWVQYFLGWRVTADRDVFDDVPVLMDFSVPQPGAGLAFVYVLPTSPREALVEYTGFGPRRVPEPEQATALAGHLVRAYGLPSGHYRVVGRERGAIPLTDVARPRPAGPGVVRIGVAGGATRGSTGYAFAAIQRQAGEVARDLLAGRPPRPSRPYPVRHRALDALLLHALDTGAVRGTDLFPELFRSLPAERVLRFLDGVSGPFEELSVMARAPRAAMLGTAGGYLRSRATAAVLPRSGRRGTSRPSPAPPLAAGGG